MKTRYDPSTMWGSYVGTLIGIFIFGYKTIILDPNYIIIRSSSRLFWMALSSLDFWLLAISGFLLGWGIHSLFRFLGTKEVRKR